MLVECGNTRDALKYCKTVLQTLKSAGMRSPEVEVCKALATSLEERIRSHMQDGSGSKLAPGKLVNKIKGTMDWGISKLIGGPPPSAPAADLWSCSVVLLAASRSRTLAGMRSRERQTGMRGYLQGQLDYAWRDLVGWAPTFCKGPAGCGAPTRKRRSWGTQINFITTPIVSELTSCAITHDSEG
ncbi:hypothetical protein KC19_3G263100, partial [Ceratodon purpureus]